MKTCNRCHQAKALTEYHKNRGARDGLSGRCKTCSAEYNKEWQARDPEKARESWRNSFKKTYDPLRNKLRSYGITKDDFAVMVAKADGKCEICSRAMPEPHIDHDHATGKVRGLLCLQCNTALGSFQDSPELLAKAIAYLAN